MSILFHLRHHLHPLMKELSISLRKRGHNIKANLKGRLVSLAALRLNAELQSQIDPWDRLILDLTKVTDIDTTGVNAILHTNMKCTYKNASMVVRCQKNEDVQGILRLTKADEHLELEVV